jgi:ATP-dependent Clp protease adaptor protein ClpS
MLPFESPEEDVDVLDDVRDTEGHHLVVFNDDVNTFEFVIDTLMEVCGHTSHQAEQCTLIIHHKGKCKVKDGTWEELVPMRQEICRRGISAEVMD